MSIPTRRLSHHIRDNCTRKDPFSHNLYNRDSPPITVSAQKNTIHQVTIMLATSKNVLFSGHNHLLTTADTQVIIKVKVHQQQGYSRWLWPGNRTILEVASMVVTWWTVAFLPSESLRWWTTQTIWYLCSIRLISWLCSAPVGNKSPITFRESLSPRYSFSLSRDSATDSEKRRDCDWFYEG